MKEKGLLAYLRQRFARVTGSLAYIPQVDGLRALALLLIFVHHVFAVYLEHTHRLGTQELPRDWSVIYDRSPLVAWGLHLAFGVPIFFAVSGFVLALPYARSMMEGREVVSTKLYLLRRVIRVEPPYMVNITLLLLVVMMPWRMGWGYAAAMLRLFGPHYLASLVYLHGLVYGGPSWVNGMAWTLEIEVQFYLLMPVIARLFRVRRTGVRRGVLAAMVAACAVFVEYGLPHLADPRWGWSLMGHLEFFLSGVLLAEIYLEPPWRVTERLGDALALVGAGLLVYVLHWMPVLAWTEAFLVLVFFWGVFRGTWAGRLFSVPWLTVPGTMCYTIYLYHYFVIERAMPLGLRLFRPGHALWVDVGVETVLMLVPVMVVSAVLYLAVERPFVVLSHRATRRWRRGATMPVVEA